jgi:cell division protein FtsZ
VAVVTKPFHFEGAHRMRLAESGLAELHSYVDTLIVIPNQNLFRLANERTTFADAFRLADQVLHMGVRGVTDLMVMPGLINLDFADIRTVMSEMGKAMMGTGEADGEKRAIEAAEAAISNPLLDDVSMKGARGVLINITGGLDMTLYEVDAAANRIREEVDPNANIIFGSTFDDSLQGRMRVSVVATGIDLPYERVAAAPAVAVEPQAELPARALGSAPFRFQAQPGRTAPAPFQAQAKAPVRRPGDLSPAVHLRAATAATERPESGTLTAPAAEPAPSAVEPAPQAQNGAAVQADPVATRPAGRSEERAPNLFERVKEFAFTRPHSSADRQPPRLSERPARPVANSHAPLTGALDEIGDIPSFLRRERVEG